MNNSKSKRIVFFDETCKTKNRINKKKTNSPRRELRKQLQNDDLLKNYFVIDTEKDETIVFRMNNNQTSANELEITKHVSSHSKIINTKQSNYSSSFQNLQCVPLELNSPSSFAEDIQLSESIRNDEPLPTEPSFVEEYQQDQLNLFLLQLCFALIKQTTYQ